MKRSSRRSSIIPGICICICLILLAGLYILSAMTAEPEENCPEETTDTVYEEDTPNREETAADSKAEDEPEQEIEQEDEPEQESEPDHATLSFAGDVMFSEQYLNAYDQNGIGAIADTGMLTHMQEADLFILNEEFPFSLRGEPMEDKQYTFRTDPKYTEIFRELGTDLVTLANNHTLDYGQEAFCDTLEALNQTGIPYAGGGYNIAEASAPAVFTVNGQTFAIFGATRVSPSYDWYATDTQPGLFQTYDPAKLNALITEADDTYDHIIVFVHWGIERSESPEDYQRALAKGYIDAGADLIVGCHPHILQGFEYYNGVPIVYSLGNYLFGNGSNDTLLLKTTFSADNSLTLQLIPCKRTGGVLSQMQEPSALYQHLADISFDVNISAEGVLSP